MVVASPTVFKVLTAASLISWAPIFSYGLSSITSFATLTPSLVTLGDPSKDPIITQFPLGPKVTFTASANV